MADLASVSIIVSGRVQGVFFRDFVYRHARRLGLKGYVQNLPGGTLEVQAEGEREKLKELVNQVKTGPPAARVEKVDADWKDYQGRYLDFSIRYSGAWRSP